MSITGDWDRRISRRTLLRTGGSAAAGLALAGVLSPRALAQGPFETTPFPLGVASGDPLPDGVVLWTRLVQQPLAADGGMPPQPFGVRYEVAHDDGFRGIVRRGAVEALPEEAHSVHVEMTGLEPDREYFYRFKVAGDVSPVGRTRTAPLATAAVDRLRFAFVSCQNYPASARTSRARRSSRSRTTGSGTPSTRPTSTCRRRTPPTPGWSPGTTTRSRTTTPTTRPTRTCCRRSSGCAARPRYRVVPTVRRRGVPASTLATFAVRDGQAGAVRV